MIFCYRSYSLPNDEKNIKNLIIFFVSIVALRLFCTFTSLNTMPSTLFFLYHTSELIASLFFISTRCQIVYRHWKAFPTMLLFFWFYNCGDFVFQLFITLETFPYNNSFFSDFIIVLSLFFNCSRHPVTIDYLRVGAYLSVLADCCLKNFQ